MYRSSVQIITHIDEARTLRDLVNKEINEGIGTTDEEKDKLFKLLTIITNAIAKPF